MESKDRIFNGHLARLKDIWRVLDGGGELKFVHATCYASLLEKDSKWFSAVDGRSYHAFLWHRRIRQFVRTETGSVETKDLVITWRKACS